MRNRLLVLLPFVTIFVACFAMAKNSDNRLMQVVTEEWPPYNYVQADGKIVGSSTVIVEKTLRNSHIPYTLNIYPWARSYDLALNHANVLIYSMIRTPEREKLFHWICPLRSVEYFVFKLADERDIEIESLDDLKKYSIGITRGTFLNQFLVKKGFIEGVNLQITGDSEASLRKLLANRIDLIIDTKEFIDEQLSAQKLKLNKVSSIYQLNSDINGKAKMCMGISLQTPIQRVEKIRSAYQELVTSP